jgi:DNA repair protein RadC
MTDEAPHGQGHRERLRKKLLTRGAEALDDYEILVLQPFDISVHDHLIVGTSGVVSFRSSGLI